MAGNERVLNEAEQRRLERYKVKCEELESEGYTKTDLTISVAKANVGALYGLIMTVPFIVIYILRYNGADFGRSRISASSGITVLALLLLLTVVHELIHGVTWSRFTKNGFKDIEFGVIWKYITPYCTCSQPLTKWEYIIGCLTTDILFLAAGVLMTIAAGGDILIAKMILGNKASKTALYLDHPTEIGLVVFQK